MLRRPPDKQSTPTVLCAPTCPTRRPNLSSTHSVLKERELQRQPRCRFGPSSIVLPSYQDQRPPFSTSAGRSMVAVRPTYLPLSIFHVAWTMCTSHSISTALVRGGETPTSCQNPGLSVTVFCECKHHHPSRVKQRSRRSPVDNSPEPLCPGLTDC